MKLFDNVNAKQDCWRQKEIVMKTYLSAWAIYYIQNVDDTTFIWNNIIFSFFPLFFSVSVSKMLIAAMSFQLK